MNKKILVISILVAVFVAVSFNTAFSKPFGLLETELEDVLARGNIFYVTSDEEMISEHSAESTFFDSIQDAIDMAQEGDIVFVLPGTYDESIILKENVHVIGSGYDKTKIDASGIGNGYAVKGASYSTLKGFHIKNADNAASVISLYTVRNMKILNNRITGKAYYGIHMEHSAFNVINGNIIGFPANEPFEDVFSMPVESLENVSLDYGIRLFASQYNSIIKNKVLASAGTGIAVYGHYAANAQIYYNLLIKRVLGGSTTGAVDLRSCNNTVLVHNTLIGEDDGGLTPSGGLVLRVSQGVKMLNNISLGTRYGIVLAGNSQLSASYSVIYSEDLSNGGAHVYIQDPDSVFDEGSHVFYEDPLVNKDNGQLFSGSPCIDEAQTIDFKDPDDTNSEIGAFHFPQ